MWHYPMAQSWRCSNNRRLITKQTELLDLIWEQTGIYHEPLKPKDFRANLQSLEKILVKITACRHTNRRQIKRRVINIMLMVHVQKKNTD